MQQSQTPTTEDTAVDAQPAATAVASNYYQRAHGGMELSGGEEGVKLYYAAAENDNLGWELGDTVVDPMYTMNRRRKEEDVTSKDSFFKRLRVKLDKNSTKEVVSATAEHNNKAEKEKEDSNADAANANAAPVIIGGMPFGFGMMNLSLFPSMGAALVDDSSERKKSEKTSKSKKNKDKEKSDEKKKRKHKDKD
ncbi:hypothetical protein GGF37_002277 [Kickxella alabastrina]|nr:hypothetical protein GGF37_002277 [Kickxella alabastrina]